MIGAPTRGLVAQGCVVERPCDVLLDVRLVMTDDDVELRNVTYRQFVDLGRAPTREEVASELGLESADAAAGWQRLHDAHALVLHPGTTELRMLNPFAMQATPYRVHADGRAWYANCAWDAFGICAALGVDGRIETACADCGEPIVVHVRDPQPEGDAVVFHCLVPARRWWDDIGFT